MAENNGEIRFKCDDLFSGTTGTIDRQSSVIRGVSIITGGQEAEGHGLTIDDQTLDELQACAKEKGKIPVTLDHGGGVKDLNGFITGFRRDGDKLRGDWHLLKTHDETERLLERAEVMPNCFGLSVAFRGPPKGVPIGGGKMAARCEKLMSIDCVTRPAANEGLFSVPEVDKSQKVMAKEKSKEVKLAEGDPQGEPTLADVINRLNQIDQRLGQHEEFLGQLQTQGEDERGPSLEDLTQMDDAELERLGLTRADVDAAVQEVVAAMEADEAGAGHPGEGELPPGEGEGELATAGVGAGAGTGTAAGQTSGTANLESLRKEVIRLSNDAKLTKLRAKREAEEVELSAIESKVLVLADQRDKAIELAEKFQAENEALRLAVRTGTRPVMAGVDNGMRLFGADGDGQLHEFQVRVKQLKDSGKSDGEAIMLAQKENPGLHAAWVESQRGKRVA